MLQTQAPVRNPASFRDPSGYVFEFEGQILRAIDAECLDTLRALHASGLLQRLIDDGLLVATTIIDDAALLERLHADHPGAAGFLRHERIHPISYPYEWSPAMLAQAGVCTLDLQMRLLEHGFSLKDATAYNLQFVNGRPVFLDVASIERPARLDVWIALGQFGRMFTNPLLLNRYKGHDLRSCFLANLDGSDVSQVRRAFGRLELLNPRLLLDVTLPYWLERRANRTTNDHPRQLSAAGDDRPIAQLMNLRRLRTKLLKLARPAKRTGHWVDYIHTCSYSQTADDAKAQAIEQFLRARRPATVLDVGCNTGRYSMLAAQAGARVVAIDSDPDCVDSLYARVREQRDAILPLCVNLANPSPAIGFRNQERTRFLDRISAECVLALAVIHHLHVSANLPIANIRDLLADLAEPYLVLEFVPTDDVMFRKLMQFRVDLYRDFTLENCLRSFGERFEILQQTPVADSPRTLLFMRKK